MTFDELYLSVKKRFSSHSEMILNCENLTAQIKDAADSFSHAFYLVWKNNKCILDQYHCDDYDVCITGTQAEIEKMFAEQQYLVQGQHHLEIEGSFQSVMLFQKLLSHITSENTYTIQKKVISNILSEQTTIRQDLDVVMQTLQLMLANSVISLPENYIGSSNKETKQDYKKEELISDLTTELIEIQEKIAEFHE